jgi:uncharacterized protein YsxB (DUF464 family)
MGAENGIDVVCSGISPNMMGSKMGTDNDVSVDEVDDDYIHFVKE